ncbi:hypothetical protein OIO90_005308 [Microbotryomycetes sp. JL221]|nr:hypothetical protein OIO90_005308 [Microbotryomycetes sp. JL221]
MYTTKRPDTPRLSSNELLPPSGVDASFEQDLFASTLGSSPRLTRRHSTFAKIQKTVRFYLPTSPKPKPRFDDQEFENEQDVIHRKVQSLDWQLCCWSLLSICLFSSLFMPTSSLSSSFEMVLIRAREQCSVIMYFLTYSSLLITFRTGVTRIAFGACGEQGQVLEDEEIEDEKTHLLMDFDVEEASLGLEELEASTQEPRSAFESIKDVLIQAVTLLSSAALLHLPVHALKDFPLAMSFAAWCISTALVGVLMWDAVRVATASFVAASSSTAYKGRDKFDVEW